MHSYFIFGPVGEALKTESLPNAKFVVTGATSGDKIGTRPTLGFQCDFPRETFATQTQYISHQEPVLQEVNVLW